MDSRECQSPFSIVHSTLLLRYTPTKKCRKSKEHPGTYYSQNSSTGGKLGAKAVAHEYKAGKKQSALAKLLQKEHTGCPKKELPIFKLQ